MVIGLIPYYFLTRKEDKMKTALGGLGVELNLIKNGIKNIVYYSELGSSLLYICLLNKTKY